MNQNAHRVAAREGHIDYLAPGGVRRIDDVPLGLVVRIRVVRVVGPAAAGIGAPYAVVPQRIHRIDKHRLRRQRPNARRFWRLDAATAI